MSSFQINLEQLSQKCFGNDELVEKLVIRFQVSLPQLVNEMLQAVDQNNMTDLRKLAHHLKGESGTMCAMEISSLAGRIIEMIDSQEPQELISLVKALSNGIATSPIQQSPMMSVE